MWERLKALLARLPGRRKRLDGLSAKTSQALRQLNVRYVRQKRLWVYIILSSAGLVVVYVIFSIFWSHLWANEVIVPAAWIVLAGIGIAIFQVRRCNDVIHTLRQTYAVQVQIEKAQAEKEALEAEAQKAGGATASLPKPSPSRAKPFPVLPDIEEEETDGSG